MVAAGGGPDLVVNDPKLGGQPAPKLSSGRQGGQALWAPVETNHQDSVRRLGTIAGLEHEFLPCRLSGRLRVTPWPVNR